MKSKSLGEVLVEKCCEINPQHPTYDILSKKDKDEFELIATAVGQAAIEEVGYKGMDWLFEINDLKAVNTGLKERLKDLEETIININQLSHSCISP